jgi:hypoxanthine phosphoribosyltransferase
MTVQCTTKERNLNPPSKERTMSDNDTVLLEDDYLDAAETIRRNAETRKRLDNEDEKAKEILAKILTDGETGVSPDGEPLVKMRPGNKMWNESEARKNLPADMLARITRTVTEEKVDKELARDILPPALYDLCTKQNRSSVVPA